MGKITSAITGLGLGMLGMYFYDAEMGGTRRAQLRDKLHAIGRIKLEAKDAMLEDARNRLVGFLYKTRSRVMSRRPSDRQLVERVRAEMGHVISNPGAIDVDAKDGTIRLTGDILASDIDRLMDAIWAVPGVKAIEHQLATHESAEHIPSLQGEQRPHEPTNLLLDEWKPGVALAFGLAGSVMALYGMSRRGVLGTTIAAAGAAVLAKSFKDAEGNRIAEKFHWV